MRNLSTPKTTSPFPPPPPLLLPLPPLPTTSPPHGTSYTTILLMQMFKTSALPKDVFDQAPKSRIHLLLSNLLSTLPPSVIKLLTPKLWIQSLMLSLSAVSLSFRLIALLSLALHKQLKQDHLAISTCCTPSYHPIHLTLIPTHHLSSVPSIANWNLSNKSYILVLMA
jgi:hypothetical protein